MRPRASENLERAFRGSLRPCQIMQIWVFSVGFPMSRHAGSSVAFSVLWSGISLDMLCRRLAIGCSEVNSLVYK